MGPRDHTYWQGDGRRPSGEIPPMSPDLVAFRLENLEADRAAAAIWREETGRKLDRVIMSVEAGFVEGTKRMDRIDKHIEATDGRVGEISSEQKALRGRIGVAERLKKDPKAFWTSIVAAIGAAAAAIVAALKGP